MNSSFNKGGSASSLGTMPIEDVGHHGLPLLPVSVRFQQFCQRQILLRSLSIHPFA